MGLLRRPGKAAAKAQAAVQSAPMREAKAAAKRVANGRDDDWEEF